MNLPKPPTSNAYNNIQDKLLHEAKIVCNKLLDKAADTLHQITSEKNPENMVEYNNELYAKVGVSVDGTWMKRGHQSKLGVVFVQSVETGEVLDYTVKSLFCYTCAKFKTKLSPKKFEEWFLDHQVKWSLPDAHTDFIIAVAAEEYGLVCVLVIILLYATIVVRSLFRLMRERDTFIRLAGTGLACSFGVQALINMGVAVRLLPTKGMTLPFVSYGGSSLIAAGMAVGMLLAFTRSRPQGELSDILGRGR